MVEVSTAHCYCIICSKQRTMHLIQSNAGKKTQPIHSQRTFFITNTIYNIHIRHTNHLCNHTLVQTPLFKKKAHLCNQLLPRHGGALTRLTSGLPCHACGIRHSHCYHWDNEHSLLEPCLYTVLGFITRVPQHVFEPVPP